MKKKIIVFGGIGTAVNVAEAIIDAEKRYNEPIEFLGFAFDDESLNGLVYDYPILCKTTEVKKKFGHLDDVSFIFQMNNQNKMRERSNLIKSYDIPNSKWHTFIHPSAFVSKSVEIGFGSVIYAHCALHSNSVIGNHCTLSACTTVGHHTIIGDNVFMATHVCLGSYVNIKDCNFLAQNTTVSTSIIIEEENLIGLGSIVVKNIEGSNKIYIGSPCKAIREINPSN